jgi:uncharacterized protein (TIGR00297 family)
MGVMVESIGQWTGLGLSYLFIFGIIGVAQLLLNRGVLDAAATRKVVHIGVAHWWIIAMLFIDDLAVALIGPVSFILINWISYRRHLFSAMEHAEPRRNLGTVYFPVALTILVLITWTGLVPRWYGLVAMLVLGWGDGTASLVGEHLRDHRAAVRFTVPGGTKSIPGTVAMLVMSAGVTALTVWLFSGPLATSPVADGGVMRGAGRLVALASQTWVAQPTDSTVLMALHRLDTLARILVETVAPAAAGLTSGAGWQLDPTTVVAIALVIAAVATAIELLTPWGLDNITVPLGVFGVLVLVAASPGVWVVRLAWALSLNILVAVVAFLRRSVTATGAVAGAGTGLVIYLAGGAFYWSVLMAFFFSATIIGRLTGRRGAGAQRRESAEAMHAKGSRRDAVQVLANGGLAAAMAAAHALTGRPIWMLGFAIAMAAATADTWASEIGVLSSREPRSILTMRTIPRGTSGGISALGLVASAGGAFFIGVWFAVGYWATHGWNGGELAAIVAAITGGGFLGSLLDSFLGATVQAQYWDTHRNAHTERRTNARGEPNRLVRGAHVLTNDAVNALSGALATAVLFVVV